MSAKQVCSGRTWHWVKFQEPEALAKTSDYMDQLVKEATETRLHPNNINREEGFRLSKAWHLTVRLLKLSDAHRLDGMQEVKY
jgi:hypothetical protein